MTASTICTYPVHMQRFPANADLVITLGLPDGSASLTAAQGKTDAKGAAEFNFPMPARWADGRLFNQSRLILTASTLDQKFSRQATIQYFK